MYKRIVVPGDIKANAIMIARVIVKRGQRVYQHDPLIQLTCDGQAIVVAAPCPGFVSHLSVKPEQAVRVGELLLTLHVMPIGDYVPDASEVNPGTELGDAGRRGKERELLREHGYKNFAAPLFDAPPKTMGHGSHSQLAAHPLLQNMKEGVPMKMQARTDINLPAQEQITDAANSPELQKQLSAELKNQLAIQSAPSAAPTLTRH